jgi:hypothetical protein
MPIALCLEDLAAISRSSRYVTCVALKGGQPGLGVNTQGKICWRTSEPLACELWVSADDQLILRRPSGAPAVRVERSGRAVDAPFDKPVVLLDQDVFKTAGRSLRVHVHGFTDAVAAPAPLPERKSVGRIAASVAIGVAAVSCSKMESCSKKVIEVRSAPPEVMPVGERDAQAIGLTDAPPDAESDVDASDASMDASMDAAVDAPEGGKRDAARKAPPIEIRHHPPVPPRHDPEL